MVTDSDYTKHLKYIVRYTLNALYNRYQLPLFIVENGFGTTDEFKEDGTIDDQERIDYLREHIQVSIEAVDEVHEYGYIGT